MLALALFGLPLAVAQNMCANSVTYGGGIDPSVFTWAAPPLPWGTTPSSAYPNGFRQAMIQGENEAVFCLTVPSSANRMVNVLVETTGTDSKICVTDPNTNPVTDSTSSTPALCQSGQFSTCFPAPTGSDLKLVFYLPQGVESALRFSYKILTSNERNSINTDNSASNNIEMWCGMIAGSNSTTYPSQLSGIGLSDQATVPAGATAQTPNNAASATTSLVLLSVLTMMIALF